ncbi:DNA-cytosine methyltransferase [Microseira wollei NIES-4236]|uniref:DNA-cytosine methyltransferase n=1 Tax=Microseira wollei NIES-4236 TaxID=2530354 RepID=A0AAV3X2W8_9CYAN|nr:DNA-cytosine methyltransferase [Microseira wollei NIES-4236]
MSELHLRVFRTRSELVLPDGTIQVFLEGGMSQSAKLKYQKIAGELSKGYLEQQIIRCRDNLAELDFSRLSQINLDTLNKLVESVTSEVGRALIGLTVLQLCVKAIEPTQSIRLHKGSVGRRDFSWQDGISMRSLDKQYITPVLRKYDLLRLNADGFMMTRSLAENYPYTPVYKANIRGARQEWLRIVESIENNEILPESALNYLLSQLWNRANEFKALAAQTIANLQQFLNSNQPVNQERITALIERHINESDYAARIMEIAMHSLMQAMQDCQILAEGVLKPLSQMRSANKKHGNVGDIELLSAQQIVESWDAKYGKSYLRDELEELADKLIANPTVAIAGFVTSVEPDRLEEILARCQEIEDELGIYIEILTFINWVKKQFERGIGDSLITEKELASAWITAYTESLAQRRREIAPIDEPCHQWLTSLKAILEN